MDQVEEGLDSTASEKSQTGTCTNRTWPSWETCSPSNGGGIALIEPVARQNCELVLEALAFRPIVQTQHSSSPSKSGILPSPTTNGFINRTNCFDDLSEDDKTKESSQRTRTENVSEGEWLASLGDVVSADSKKNQFRHIETHLSGTKEHHTLDSNSMGGSDHEKYSCEGSEQSFPIASINADKDFNESFCFEDVEFPEPKTPKKTQSNNSSTSVSFLKSPFSPPSLRNHINRRHNMEKQTSFRSIETKSTIDGGASAELERQRKGFALEERSKNMASEILRKPRKVSLVKSNSAPHLPNSHSTRHRRTKTSRDLGKEHFSDTPNTTSCLVTCKKALNNVPINPLNPAEAGKWTLPATSLKNINDSLLAKKDDQGKASSRRNFQKQNPNSENSSSLRSSFRTKSPRTSSRRNLIIDDPSRLSSRFQRQGRPTSPHALVATAAATRARCTSRSPSVGRSTRIRPIVRSQSPHGKILDTGRYPQSPQSTTTLSPSPLTTEQIIQQIRAGNFHLKAVGKDGKSNSPSTGRITLEITSATRSPRSTEMNRFETPHLPVKMPLVGQSSQSSMEVSIEGNDDDDARHDETRMQRPSRMKRNTSGSSRRSRSGSQTPVDADDDFRKARTRVGRSRDNEDNSKHRSLSRGSRRSIRGSQPEGHDQGQKSTGRSKSRERRSRRARSRSRSKEPRSCLRRSLTSSSSDDIPQLPGSAFRLDEQTSPSDCRSRNLKEQSSSLRRSTRNLYDHSPALRRSTRNIKDSSPGRSHVRHQSDSIEVGPYHVLSSRCQTPSDKSERLLVPSPIKPKKQPSNRHLFSTDWAQEINDWTLHGDTNENLRQPMPQPHYM